MKEKTLELNTEYDSDGGFEVELSSTPFPTKRSMSLGSSEMSPISDNRNSQLCSPSIEFEDYASFKPLLFSPSQKLQGASRPASPAYPKVASPVSIQDIDKEESPSGQKYLLLEANAGRYSPQEIQDLAKLRELVYSPVSRNEAIGISCKDNHHDTLQEIHSLSKTILKSPSHENLAAWENQIHRLPESFSSDKKKLFKKRKRATAPKEASASVKTAFNGVTRFRKITTVEEKRARINAAAKKADSANQRLESIVFHPSVKPIRDITNLPHDELKFLVQPKPVTSSISDRKVFNDFYTFQKQIFSAHVKLLSGLVNKDQPVLLIRVDYPPVYHSILSPAQIHLLESRRESISVKTTPERVQYLLRIFEKKLSDLEHNKKIYLHHTQRSRDEAPDGNQQQLIRLKHNIDFLVEKENLYINQEKVMQPLINEVIDHNWRFISTAIDKYHRVHCILSSELLTNLSFLTMLNQCKRHLCQNSNFQFDQHLLKNIDNELCEMHGSQIALQNLAMHAYIPEIYSTTLSERYTHVSHELSSQSCAKNKLDLINSLIYKLSARRNTIQAVKSKLHPILQFDIDSIRQEKSIACALKAIITIQMDRTSKGAFKLANQSIYKKYDVYDFYQCLLAQKLILEGKECEILSSNTAMKEQVKASPILAILLPNINLVSYEDVLKQGQTPCLNTFAIDYEGISLLSIQPAS